MYRLRHLYDDLPGQRDLLRGGHPQGVAALPRHQRSILQQRARQVRTSQYGSWYDARPRCTRSVVARFSLHSRDPVEVRGRDGVLSEEEAQLGRMFLDVAQTVELQFQVADRLPL